MTRHIFTYGSLMFADVWQRVVAGRYGNASGIIRDHGRYAVINEIYPGVVAQPGSQVKGVVYFNVEAADIAALDIFEGLDYVRQAVQVQLPDKVLEADTYLYCKPAALSAQDWDPRCFEMEKFLQTYCRSPDK